MAYSLAQAAVAAGRSRSTVLRAIQTGRLSAARDETTGAWIIEPAELHRVYPVADRHAVDTANRHEDGGGDATALIEVKDALIAEQRQTIEDLRRRLDTATEQLGEALQQVRLLTDQRTAPPAAVPDSVPVRRWWKWRRRD